MPTILAMIAAIKSTMYGIALMSLGPPGNSGGAVSSQRTTGSLLSLSTPLRNKGGEKMSQPRLRLYPPHLDTPLTRIQAEKLISDPENISHHAFLPFLQRNQQWTKFAPKGTKLAQVKKKERPIRYASRRDSYIFSYFRNQLSPLYEAELRRLGLQDCVLAYRRIPIKGGRGGKCNIHFAREAFETIRSFGDCYVFALDILKFFENLDHERVRQLWCRLLAQPPDQRGRQRLPNHHFKAYKAVTDYSFIDVNCAYKKLGLIGEKLTPSGKKSVGYLKSRKDFPLQICSPKVFREKLTGIIEHNPNPFGIPQGSPISDLLANLYMIEFDHKMNGDVLARGGRYFRYSDDILIVLPAPHQDWQELISQVEDALTKNAPRLSVNKEKTQVYHYQTLCDDTGQSHKILNCPKGPDGLEYLGFRYDGRHVYLRNSTVSGIQRKIASVANRLARRHIKKNPAMGLQQLIDSFNYSLLISKFGRVKDFDSSGKTYTDWTFWTYVVRSIAIFGDLGKPISRQFGSYKSFAKKKAKEAIVFFLKHRT
jgi:hypothetical protein